MTDQASVDPAVEETARSMGWLPKEEFRGDQAKWQDAASFVSRGENFVPFLRKDVKNLRAENDRLKGQVQQLTAAQKAAQESLETLTAYNAEVARREAKDQARQIRREIIEARKEGNAEREAELEETLAEHNAKAAEIGKPKESESTTSSSTPKGAPAGSGPPAADPTQTPEFQAFKSKYTWVDSDPVMTAAANAILGQLLKDPEFQKLSLQDKWERVAQDTEKRFDVAPRRPPSKFDSGNGSTRETTRRSDQKLTYADLPPEVKKLCDSFIPKVVGKDRAYKTADEWRAKYVADLPADWSSAT